MFSAYVGAFHVFEYQSPLVTIKDGEGWIINGYLNVVHVINLEEFENMLQATADIFAALAKEEREKKVFEYQLQKTHDRIATIRGVPRNKRSINWIGSAWKWIAGSPDAADWDKVLESQQRLIENNEQQYIVNSNLFGATSELVKKMNDLMARFNNKIVVSETNEILHDALNQISVIKENIEEIVRACQLAKGGIINTNLLDVEEIHQIISEVESLPYNNEIEAIEYGKPSIFSNGTSLLYVLSIPKVNPVKYNKILLRAAIRQNRQIDLKHNTVLINYANVYGIRNHCSSLNNITICALDQLEELSDKDCLSRMLRGTNANCTFRSNGETIIEQIEDDILYVSNFKGNVSSERNTAGLDGTYLIRLFNETITIGERTFVSERITKMQALPPLLTNVYEKAHKVDVNFLHELHGKNIQHIQNLKNNVNLFLWSNVTSFGCIVAVSIILTLVWRKIYGRITMPALRLPGNLTTDMN